MLNVCWREEQNETIETARTLPGKCIGIEIHPTAYEPTPCGLNHPYNRGKESQPS